MIPHPLFRRLLFCLLSFPAVLAGQTPTPPTKPQPPQRRQVSPEAYQQAVQLLRARIGLATSKVFGAIQDQENAVFTRFNYFQKPDRFEPGSFASKDDIAAWQKSLSEMRTAQTTLENMYTSVDLDLGSALTAQRIVPKLANPIKKELLSSFPWDLIHQKNQIMDRYLDEHGQLLAFYETNWGAWTKPPGTVKAKFTDSKLASDFTGLCSKIQADGKQISDLYAKIKK